MEWIRLTKSGKDLAGTGGRLLEVTAEELRKHKKRGDAWIALNGKFCHLARFYDLVPLRLRTVAYESVGSWERLHTTSQTYAAIINTLGKHILML